MDTDESLTEVDALELRVNNLELELIELALRNFMLEKREQEIRACMRTVWSRLQALKAEVVRTLPAADRARIYTVTALTHLEDAFSVSLWEDKTVEHTSLSADRRKL